MVLRLFHREDRLVVVNRAESGHRLGQVLGGHNANDAWDRSSFFGVDRHDPRVAVIDMNQLDVEHRLEADVGDELLLARHTSPTAEPTLRGSNRLRVHDNSLAASTASQICT